MAPSARLGDNSPGRCRRVKRRLLILVTFILAGAIVNVAVAWGLAIRITPGFPSPTVPAAEGIYEGADDSQWWWCQILVRPGHAQVVWERPYVAKRPKAYSGSIVVEVSEEIQSDLRGAWRSRRLADWMRSQGLDPGDTTSWPPEPDRLLRLLQVLADPQEIHPDRVDQDAIPSWAGSPHRIESGGRVRRAFGWPRVAMWHENLLILRSRQQVVTSGGLRLADGSQFLGPGRILPYRIIARGFAINSSFYAALLWVLICGPFALRRLIRARRGLCPGCGYDLGHAEHRGCPECGAVA